MNIDLSHIDLEYGVFKNTQENNHEERIVGVKRYDGKIYTANSQHVYCIERLDSEFMGYISARDFRDLLLKSVSEQHRRIETNNVRIDGPREEINDDDAEYMTDYVIPRITAPLAPLYVPAFDENKLRKYIGPKNGDVSLVLSKEAYITDGVRIIRGNDFKRIVEFYTLRKSLKWKNQKGEPEVFTIVGVFWDPPTYGRCVKIDLKKPYYIDGMNLDTVKDILVL